MFIRSCS